MCVIEVSDEDIIGEDNDPMGTTVTSIDDRVRHFLDIKLAPTLAPLSQDRIIGAALFLVALVKVIALITSSTNSGLRLGCFLALAYSTSYLTIELITWSCAFQASRSGFKNTPAENLLDLLRLVDPGDNPLTFADKNTSLDSQSLIPLGDWLSTGSFSRREPNFPTTQIPPKRWNRAVAIATISLGLIGPLMWIVMLSNIWDPAKGAWILAVSAVGFFALRFIGKLLYNIARKGLSRTPRRVSSLEQGANIHAETGNVKNDPFVQYNTHGVLVFFLVWTWRRITTVNIYAMIWIIVVSYYFAHVFPVKAGLGYDSEKASAPQKPQWLDWLG